MTYTPKDWRNATTHEGGGDTSTPISAVAIEDLETRVTDYSDDHAAAFSVIDYGADPTGASDSTTDFETTCTTAGVGAHIYVPEGTYILERVNLSVDHQTWEFAPGAILKLKDAATFKRCFEIEGDYITIIGGEWDGNRANNAGAVSGVIDVDGANHLRIRDVYIHDTDYVGIRVYPAEAGGIPLVDVEINGGAFVDCAAGGVFFNATGLASAPGNAGWRILNCWSDNSSMAVGTVTGGGFTINGGTDTSLANFARGCVIANCYAKSRVDATEDNAGIGLWAVDGGEMTGCYAEAMSFEGLLVASSRNVAVTGCTARKCGDYGFEIVGNTAQSLVSVALSGCYVEGDATTLNGIMLNDAFDSTVSGCVVRNLVDSTAAVGIAIANPNSHAGTGRLNITGNTINTTYIGIGDTDDIAKDITVADNTLICSGSQTEEKGIWVDVTGSATNTSFRRRYVNNHFTDFYYGIYFYNNNAVATYKDVISRYNTTFGATTPTAKDGNITFDATCSIDDEALLGWAV